MSLLNKERRIEERRKMIRLSATRIPVHSVFSINDRESSPFPVNPKAVTIYERKAKTENQNEINVDSKEEN